MTPLSSPLPQLRRDNNKELTLGAGARIRVPTLKPSERYRDKTDSGSFPISNCTSARFRFRRKPSGRRKETGVPERVLPLHLPSVRKLFPFSLCQVYDRGVGGPKSPRQLLPQHRPAWPLVWWRGAVSTALPGGNWRCQGALGLGDAWVLVQHGCVTLHKFLSPSEPLIPHL